MKERSNPSFPHKKTMVSAAVILALSFLPIGAAMAAPAGTGEFQTGDRLVVENRETGEVYADVPIEAGMRFPLVGRIRLNIFRGMNIMR